ncbi:MAG: DUF951 domain-containing protein [Clostridia bacterium]|nr:DUF951 domain-containing protein [Clostridia bacterium]
MDINDKLVFKKQHPCGGNVWTVIGLGADVKLKCDLCGRILLVPRDKIDKMVKKILSEQDGK